MKSDKSPRIISADLNNNLKKFSTAKIGEHIFEDIQCKIYGRLILQKISIVFVVEKIV